MRKRRQIKNLKYGLTEKTVIEEWAKNYPPVMTYIDKINGRPGCVALELYKFCKFHAHMDPNQLLDLKKDYNSLEAERLLDSLKNADTPIPKNRRWHTVMCVRGFFRANYRQLQSEAGRSMPYIHNESSRMPSKPKRLAMFKACQNPRDKTLVMLASTTAIALDTMANLRFSNFEENWEEQEIPHISLPPELLKGHGLGKYSGVRQETFLTPEAKQVLLEYRHWMETAFNYKWKDDDHVLLSVKRNTGEPLTKCMIAKKATVLQKRASHLLGHDVEFTLHDGRRILQTAMESVSCPNNWIKKLKGRKCCGEEAPYSKPAIEQLRKKYAEALPELEFLQDDEGRARVIAEMKTENEDLKMDQRMADKRIEELEAAVEKLYKFINEKDSLERMAENSIRAERTKALHLPPPYRHQAK